MHIAFTDASSESFKLSQTQLFKTFLYYFTNKHIFKQSVELPERLQSVISEMFIPLTTATW